MRMRNRILAVILTGVMVVSSISVPVLAYDDEIMISDEASEVESPDEANDIESPDETGEFEDPDESGETSSDETSYEEPDSYDQQSEEPDDGWVENGEEADFDEDADDFSDEIIDGEESPEAEEEEESAGSVYDGGGEDIFNENIPEPVDEMEGVRKDSGNAGLQGAASRAKETTENHLEAIPEQGDIKFSGVEYRSYLEAEVGEPVTLSVSVSADNMEGIQYSWVVHSSPELNVIPDPTADSITVVPAVYTNGDEFKCYTTYICKVTDIYGNCAYCDFNIHVNNHLKIYPGEHEPSEFEDLSDTDFLRPVPNEEVTLTTTVSAVDKSSLEYRWSKYVGREWERIEGEAEDRLTLSATHHGYYKCLVCDQYGNESVCFYYLTIETNLEAYPEGNQIDESSGRIPDVRYINVKPGDELTLTVVASSDDPGPLYYRWYDEEGNLISAPEGNSITVTVTKPTGYRCDVADSYNSTSCSFDIRTPRKIIAYPSDNIPDENGNILNQQEIHVRPHETVTLSAELEAEDYDGLTYGWYGNGTNLLAESTKSITVNTDDYGYCSFVAYDPYGNTGSCYFNFIIENDFTAYPSGNKPDENGVISDEQQLMVTPNGQVTLSVETDAIEKNGITYAWLNESNNYLDGENSNSITVTLPEDTYSARYTCEATDRYGHRKYCNFQLFIINNLTAHPAGEIPDENGDYWGEQRFEAVPYEEITMSVVADAIIKDGINYTWYDENRNPIGGNTKDLTVTATRSTVYFCEVHDRYGHEAPTCSFIIEINNNLKVYPKGNVPDENGNISNMKSLAVLPDEEITLSVEPKGDDLLDLEYTWLDSSGNDLGSSTDTLTIATSENNTYYCFIRDRYNNTAYCSFSLRMRNDLNVHPVGSGTDENGHPLSYLYLTAARNEEVTLSVVADALDDKDLVYSWKDMYYTSLGGNTKDLTITASESTTYYCNVTDRYGNSESCWFRINIALPQQIKASIASDEMEVGETAMIDVTGAQGWVSYRSSDTSVAVVDDSGEITAVGEGNVRIIVTAEQTGNYAKGTAEVRLTVVKKPQHITVMVVPANITMGEITAVTVLNAEGMVTYSSSDSTIATVSSTGVIKGLKGGIVDITVTASATEEYKADTATVKVVVAKASQNIKASAASGKITTGKTTNVSVTGAKGKVSYSSSDTGIATVSSTGVVKGLKGGTVTITATAAETASYKAGKATVKITVEKAPQTIKAKTATTKLAFGKTTTVSVTGAKGKLTYTSSDKGIATVSSTGVVKAVKTGTVTITASAAETAAYKAGKATVKITVVKAAQPMTVSAKAVSVKKTKVKKKAAVIAKGTAFSIKNSQGAVTFKKTGGSGKLSITKNGKIKVKKGTGKGAYKISVKVSAAGNNNYNAGSKNVSVTVTVK